MKDQIEKQAIEELFDIITTDCDHICDVCEFQDNDWCFTHYVSARIYNAGYRKQEWISVDERLPEPNVECLVATKVGNRMVVDMGELIPCWDTRTGENYCEWMITNDWDEGEGCEITHWMPLPEPPKMKGGAENG